MKIYRSKISFTKRKTLFINRIENGQQCLAINNIISICFFSPCFVCCLSMDGKNRKMPELDDDDNDFFFLWACYSRPHLYSYLFMRIYNSSSSTICIVHIVSLLVLTETHDVHAHLIKCAFVWTVRIAVGLVCNSSRHAMTIDAGWWLMSY